jgi:hypothetical protein
MINCIGDFFFFGLVEKKFGKFFKLWIWIKMMEFEKIIFI